VISKASHHTIKQQQHISVTVAGAISVVLALTGIATNQTPLPLGTPARVKEIISDG